MDNISKEERSRVMASVKQKDTKPEMKVRSFLHRCGLRYRLHDPRLPGKPDLVFPRHGTVLFVHGCFWHGHREKSCKLARIPKSNILFWKEKITANHERDKRNTEQLRMLGWKVIVVWECQIGNVEFLSKIATQIKTSIK
ncbi:MAG TPA: DNA mismatch endonuclease Vsr [Alphaproteobacteria bacterium]|nr:DNA mismatch endonuclease Vsr [Alphaproteobacteria bacterium]